MSHYRQMSQMSLASNTELLRTARSRRSLPLLKTGFVPVLAKHWTNRQQEAPCGGTLGS